MERSSRCGAERRAPVRPHGVDRDRAQGCRLLDRHVRQVLQPHRSPEGPHAARLVAHLPVQRQVLELHRVPERPPADVRLEAQGLQHEPDPEAGARRAPRGTRGQAPLRVAVALRDPCRPGPVREADRPAAGRPAARSGRAGVPRHPALVDPRCRGDGPIGQAGMDPGQKACSEPVAVALVCGPARGRSHAGRCARRLRGAGSPGADGHPHGGQRHGVGSAPLVQQVRSLRDAHPALHPLARGAGHTAGCHPCPGARRSR